MKKLIAIISVLAAGFVGTAKADITMSAGSNLEMQSIGSSTNLSIGGSLGFAFSQDLGNGVTVTMSGLSFGNDVAVVDNIATGGLTTTSGTALNATGTAVNGNMSTTGVFTTTTNTAVVNADAVTTNTFLQTASHTGSIDADAFEQISFATANGTLTYGSDIDLEGFAGLGVGDVTTSDLADTDLGAGASALTYGNVVGNGLTYATSLGGTSLTIGYVLDNDGGADKFDTSATSNNTMAIKSAIPVGPLSVTVGYIADNTTSAKVTTTGASTSMAAGNGTFSVAYVQTAVTGNDSSQISAKYATTLGAASLSIGYSSTDTNTKTNTNDITATISQSVGTGASVFAEFISRDGLATSSDESSAILLGSSFAF
jgi:hypothetical protein